MRLINPDAIHQTVISAINYITYHPDPELTPILERALQNEDQEIPRDVIRTILDNHRLSPEIRIPLCQDTGTTVVFAELGCAVQLEEPLEISISRAVAAAQRALPLRASMVSDPLFSRTNTLDNSPAIVHLKIVEGDRLKLIIGQKGGGAENMSFLRMFNPTVGMDELIDYIAQAVVAAGSRPCPPLILGIGIGGNFETAPLLAKRALFEPLGRAHPNPKYQDVERRILEKVNAEGCGVQGFGGKNTVLAVHILEAPCHIASLPLAVNVECHAHRHIELEVSRETD
jgi:fumarate hydratase subunit alpha